ncbi:MAG: cobalamin biosynthesis protein CobD, partial [Alphaproteobacteria bacterium]|nr:cobalamin biosynthesis protein CobD [Alphaproteobacteria bacterium]
MITGSLFIAATQLLLEGLLGYPQALFRAIGHPVTWIGGLIARLDRSLNRLDWSFFVRRLTGVVALLILLGVTGGIAIMLDLGLGQYAIGLLVIIVIAATLPAQRSLDEHVRAVADALEQNGVEGGRKAVSMIVGRKTDTLDEAGISRAAIESLAENFSDGVVAPIFWTACLGLPGGVLYKAINTADSMIGHKNEKYHAFGWAAARLDDLVNLPCSRLSALLFILAALFVRGASSIDAFTTVLRDARKHRSPNAGWPEAAMAGALGFALAGPRIYGETMVDDVYMGDG